MAYTLRVNGVNRAFREAREEILRVAEREVSLRTLSLVTALRNATPVDTGRARDAWSIGFQRRLFNETQLTITNDVSYIVDLNMGSSSQAPARFIERNALRFFTPDGIIAQVRR